MSNKTPTDAQRQQLAEAFGRTLDPLAEFEATFEQTGIDPFDLFITDVLEPEEPAPKTRRAYEALFEQWREVMADVGRHPACPTEDHVKAFVRYLDDDRGNTPRTIKLKLNRLNRAYEYWQDDPTFPHPQDYNPVQLAKSKMNLTSEVKKTPPRIPLEDLRAVVGSVTHLRDHAMILMQLKLGLRATELCNIKLEELALTNADMQGYYSEMGTANPLREYENCIYIPSRYERKGNKSYCPRILPLDDELRRVLTQYLLIRPSPDRPWLFLSKSNHSRIDDKDVNRAWKAAFHPEYQETETHRAVTSHYGRHWFTTYWKVEQDWNRELIKYMRGDKVGTGQRNNEAIDSYIHTYYEDVREGYLDEIFKLIV